MAQCEWHNGFRRNWNAAKWILDWVRSCSEGPKFVISLVPEMKMDSVRSTQWVRWSTSRSWWTLMCVWWHRACVCVCEWVNAKIEHWSAHGSLKLENGSAIRLARRYTANRKHYATTLPGMSLTPARRFWSFTLSILQIPLLTPQKRKKSTFLSDTFRQLFVLSFSFLSHFFSYPLSLKSFASSKAHYIWNRRSPKTRYSNPNVSVKKSTTNKTMPQNASKSRCEARPFEIRAGEPLDSKMENTHTLYASKNVKQSSKATRRR